MHSVLTSKCRFSCLRHTCTQRTRISVTESDGAAGADALERSFLQQEFLTVKMEVKARVDKAQNVTVSLDAWPDTTGRYVFCCTVALPDRCLHVEEKQDAEACAGQPCQVFCVCCM